MPTPEQVQALADAMWQLLDDMGTGGQCVCLAAKAQARIAFEPFVDEPEAMAGIMSLADAERVAERVADDRG
jgi:hypothetical protein